MGKILQNRPLVVFAVGLAIGLTFREHPGNLLLLIPISMILGQFRAVSAAFVGLLLGVFLSPNLPDRGFEGTTYLESPALVVDVPRLNPSSIGYTIEVQGHRLSVFEPPSSDRSKGDRLWVKGLVKPLAEGNEHQLQRGIVGTFMPTSIDQVSPGPPWYRQALVLRKYFVGSSFALLGGENAAILDALCFNVDSRLSPDFERDLRDTGTYHIISASGLHVFVLAWALEWLLGLLPIPRPIRLALLGLALLFYAAAAGWQAPILRSVLMSMVMAPAYIWKREADLLSALALAAVLYLLSDPIGIYSIGFQFSFITVAAFALFDLNRDSMPTSAMEAIRDLFRQALHTTHVAYWVTLPLLAYYFGTISIVAIPSNIVVVPAVSALVVLGMVAVGVLALAPSLAELLARALIEPLISYLQWVLDIFANFKLATLPAAHFNAYWLLVIYVAMMFLARERVRPA